MEKEDLKEKEDLRDKECRGHCEVLPSSFSILASLLDTGCHQGFPLTLLRIWVREPSRPQSNPFPGFPTSSEQLLKVCKAWPFDQCNLQGAIMLLTSLGGWWWCQGSPWSELQLHFTCAHFLPPAPPFYRCRSQGPAYYTPPQSQVPEEEPSYARLVQGP